MKNYYHILGLTLESNPDAELISQCHKALIKIFHPEVFKGDKKLGEKKEGTEEFGECVLRLSK